MTKRLANLIYKIPAGTKVTTRYCEVNQGIIHENIKTLRDRIFEKRDVFVSTADETTFMDFGCLVVAQNKDIETYRERRGKLVKIPTEWLGKVTNPQTIRKRKSKKGQGARYKAKVQR